MYVKKYKVVDKLVFFTYFYFQIRREACRVLRVFVIISLILVSQIHSQPLSDVKFNPIREYSGQTVFDLKSVPEENIDIGLWSLIIAKEYDSTIDINHYLNQLDKMSAEINRMIAGRDGDMVKFMMTKMYIYDSGQWNNNQPYSYDLDDPLGIDAQKRLFSYYIDNKKGNCVSMPTLFLALMERVDPNIQFFGVSSPIHLFCRMYDRQTGEMWNVESTNGGSPARDAWYIEQHNIAQTAIDSGLYLRTLTKKEYVSELIGVLVSKFRNEAQYEKALKYNKLRMKLNSNSATTLVQQGSLLAWMGHTMQEHLLSQKRNPTPEEIESLKLYQVESEKYINLAMLKGWKPEKPEERDHYLETINKEKDK